MTGFVGIQGDPIAGAKTLYISGATGFTGPSGPIGPSGINISVFQFPSTFQSADAFCTPSNALNGTPLMLVTGTTSGLTANPGATSPYLLTLSQPLVEGTQLCVTETDGGQLAAVSTFKTVVDPTNFGRVRASFTTGVMVNNQQAGSNSSTAGEYLDMQLTYFWVLGGIRPCTHEPGKPDHCRPRTDNNKAASRFQGHRYAPGFNTFFNARLSPVSVATTTTTTGISGATGSTGVSSNLNLLTSQQGLKIMLGTDLPFRTRGWNQRTNAFAIGPVGKASFDTILNPSVSSNSVASGNSSSQTTGNFSSLYTAVNAGARLQWDSYAKSTDFSPKTLAMIDLTMGQFSNFPSYECVAKSGGTGGPVPTNATSACGTGANTNLMNVSRVLVPRVDILGFVKFPNYPFVLGIDANLAQSALGTPKTLDYLNKPGNDIRVFVGFTIDFATLFKGLGTGQ